MAFTDDEIVRILHEIETHCWAKRRPRLALRNKIREGQRVVGQSVELFFIRPQWDDPTCVVEDSIAKATYVRSRRRWRVYWQRSDLRWHPYEEKREVASLPAFLKLIDEDRFG